MNKKTANEKISVLVKEAKEKIREAEKIATEAGVSFSFSVAYGMGGEFVADPEEIADIRRYDSWKFEDGKPAWYASSQSC